MKKTICLIIILLSNLLSAQIEVDSLNHYYSKKDSISIEKEINKALNSFRNPIILDNNTINKIKYLYKLVDVCKKNEDIQNAEKIYLFLLQYFGNFDNKLLNTSKLTVKKLG